MKLRHWIAGECRITEDEKSVVDSEVSSMGFDSDEVSSLGLERAKSLVFDQIVKLVVWD